MRRFDPAPEPAMPTPSAKTFLVCHGAWGAGYGWRKMHPLMAAAGHRLVTPSYTGLGERAHLAHQGIDLEFHINDILQVIKYEDLSDVVLLGHSYGGMVATGVADRARDRITQLIYLDAFVPEDGQSLFDLTGNGEQSMKAVAAGDGWRAPPNPTPPDTSEEDAKWAAERRTPHPVKCFSQPLKLQRGPLTLPRSYIYALRINPNDTFGQFAKRAKTTPGWRYYDIDASHSPQVTAPEALFALLQKIVKER
jgi:pimeloyl-ACP methyl ester carboxylesterase